MPIDGTRMPPPIYDHTPNIPVIEYVLTSEEVNKVCIRVMDGEAPTGKVWTGCARITGKAMCYIWRIDDSKTKRHEQAHCNGWSNNHETEAEIKAKEAVAKPWVPDWEYRAPLLPWPKIDPDMDTLKQVLTATKELSTQLRR